MNSYTHIRIDKRIFVSAVMMAFCVFTPTELMAQRFAIQAQGGPKWAARLHEQLTQKLNEKKAEAENRMASLLADIDRACDLSDAQLKKLTVASKGAVKSYMAAATKNVVSSTKQAGFKFDPDNPPDANEEEENEKFVPGRNFVMLDLNPDAKNKDAEYQTIWTSTIKKTLSEQQTKKLDSWLDQRKSFIRNSAVDNFIAKVDLKLLLSRDQREKLTVWVDKNHGQQLAERIASPPVQNQGVIFLGQGQAIIQPDATIHLEVAAILSDSQQNQWLRSFQPELDRN